MKTKILLLAIALIGSGISFAQETPERADKVLESALKQAAKENKAVMIVFHASWCGWCKKFDASVNDPSCKEFFDRSFVIKHLTILERGDMIKTENPGALELFENNGGKGGGIPYFLIFDKSGKILADSRMKPAGGGPEAKLANMGCPAADEEVAAFIGILKKTSKITDKEAVAVTERFKKNKS
jgi:thiol-disulfide isomerase/thioredoxin